MPERTLAVHNRERAQLGLQPLHWDARLAEDARHWATKLAQKGYLVHSPDDPSARDPQGENLWAGTSGYYSVESMNGLWLAEKRNFTKGRFPRNSRTGDVEDVGHYTQMIWSTTGEIGCALARGKIDDFFVCRYLEGGNVMGESPLEKKIVRVP